MDFKPCFETWRPWHFLSLPFARGVQGKRGEGEPSKKTKAMRSKDCVVHVRDSPGQDQLTNCADLVVGGLRVMARNISEFRFVLVVHRVHLRRRQRRDLCVQRLVHHRTQLDLPRRRCRRQCSRWSCSRRRWSHWWCSWGIGYRPHPSETHPPEAFDPRLVNQRQIPLRWWVG